MATYDFTLCMNKECPKACRCQRYLAYARGVWKNAYVLRGCIDFQLYKKV